jgi:predicted transcriptional regulator
MDSGFITIHRKLTEWEWYDDIPTKVLFLHLLLTVNWKDKQWHGITIKRGQIITGVPRLSEQTQLSEMQVRRALDNLVNTGEVNRQTTNRYSLITLNKYNDYQDRNSQTTFKEQSNNIQTTTTKQRNKETIKQYKVTTDDLFVEFWNLYPKKTGKGAAKKSWEKIKSKGTVIEEIKNALSWQKESTQWNREGGQFIPNPSTYLNQERWQDEMSAEKTKKVIHL